MLSRKRRRGASTTGSPTPPAVTRKPRSTKLAVFDHYPEWDSVVVGSTFVDEYTREAAALRNGFLIAGAVLLACSLSHSSGPFVRWCAGRWCRRWPRRSASPAVTSPARSAFIPRTRLASCCTGSSACRRTCGGWSARIHGSAEAISAATQQIAAGNADLAQRTESQASSLEETASSMEETDLDRQAERRQRPPGQPAGRSARPRSPSQGGEVVAQVVGTMGEINDSSQARSPTSSA